MNVGELGLVTPAGKVVWGKTCVLFSDLITSMFWVVHRLIRYDLCYAGKYAQVTNDPENDGCINAVLLV